MDKSDAIAASGLVSASLLASLVQMLVIKGMLTTREVQDVYDTALFILEKQQAAAPAEMAAVYAAARAVIEDQLRQ